MSLSDQISVLGSLPTAGGSSSLSADEIAVLLGYADAAAMNAAISAGGNPAIADISDWPSGLTAAELGYVNGVTSALQTQLDAKITASVLTTNGDLLTRTAGVPARLALGSALQVLRTNAGATALEFADRSFPSICLTRSASLNPSANTETNVGWDTQLYTPDALFTHSTSTNNHNIAITRAQKILMLGVLILSAASSGTKIISTAYDDGLGHTHQFINQIFDHATNSGLLYTPILRVFDCTSSSVLRLTSFRQTGTHTIGNSSSFLLLIGLGA